MTVQVALCACLKTKIREKREHNAVIFWGHIGKLP
jgi:hypothetical protein